MEESLSLHILGRGPLLLQSIELLNGLEGALVEAAAHPDILHVGAGDRSVGEPGLAHGRHAHPLLSREVEQLDIAEVLVAVVAADGVDAVGQGDKGEAPAGFLHAGQHLPARAGPVVPLATRQHGP